MEWNGTGVVKLVMLMLHACIDGGRREERGFGQYGEDLLPCCLTVCYKVLYVPLHVYFLLRTRYCRLLSFAGEPCLVGSTNSGIKDQRSYVVSINSFHLPLPLNLMLKLLLVWLA